MPIDARQISYAWAPVIGFEVLTHLAESAAAMAVTVSNNSFRSISVSSSVNNVVAPIAPIDSGTGLADLQTCSPFSHGLAHSGGDEFGNTAFETKVIDGA
jgi:hypothetical protein